MQVIDNGTWVKMIAATGMDLINTEGFRTKTVGCPTAQQSAWSEVAELVEEVYTAPELTEYDRWFLRTLVFDFQATAEYVRDLRDAKKITTAQFDKIKTKLTARKAGIDYYILNKANITKAQLIQCIDKIIG